MEQDQEYDLFEYISQDPAPWHLSRISHTRNDASNYVYDDSAGEGTCTYIIDTGIRADHEEFEGRAEFLHNFTDDGNDGDGTFASIPWALVARQLPIWLITLQAPVMVPMSPVLSRHALMVLPRRARYSDLRSSIMMV